MPESRLDEALFARANGAISNIEKSIQELQDALTAIRDAFVEIYPPDGTMDWFAAWEKGRLGELWGRLEGLEEIDLAHVIEAAIS